MASDLSPIEVRSNCLLFIIHVVKTRFVCFSNTLYEEKLCYSMHLSVTGFASVNRQIKDDDLLACRFFFLTFIVVDNCDVTLEANLLMPKTQTKMLACETQNLIYGQLMVTCTVVHLKTVHQT